MSVTDLEAVQDQIQTIWSPIFMKELRESFLLPSIVSKQYEGDIRKQNDTVRISQVNSLTSDLRTVGVDADSFETNQLSTSYVDLKADKRAVSAIEVEDLVEIQSIIDPIKGADVRQAMMHDIGRQINTYLYSLLVPSTSAPDHTIGGQATLTNTLLATMREDAALAHWSKAEKWYSLLSPQYYSDFLADNNLNTIDYGFSDAARVGGQASQKRYGFDMFEDDSLTAASLYSLTPSALLYAAQTEAKWQVSSGHANKKFGYTMSVDLCFGAKLSIDGDKKCYKITAAA